MSDDWVTVVMVGLLFDFAVLVWAFDGLLRYQHTHHRERWEQEGASKGVFVRPDGWRPAWFPYSFYSWALSTPDWVAAQPHLVTRLWIGRVAMGLWFSFFLCGFAAKWLGLFPEEP